MNYRTIKKIWRKQLDYVKAVADDILKHNGSKEILEYASTSKYIEIEAPEDFNGRSDENESIRINCGEAYAYLDYAEDGSGNLAGTIRWNNEDMGIKSDTYEDSIVELEESEDVDRMAYEFTDAYDDEEVKSTHELIYRQYTKSNV